MKEKRARSIGWQARGVEISQRGTSRALNRIAALVEPAGIEILEARALQARRGARGSVTIETARRKGAKRSREMQPAASSATGEAHAMEGIFAALVHPSGAVTWHFPARSRGMYRRTITVTIAATEGEGQPAPEGSGVARGRPTESLSSKKAAKGRRTGRGVSPELGYVLVLLASPLLSGLAKKGLGYLVEKWEGAKSPYALRRAGAGGKLHSRPLPHLPHYDGKRGLLLIPGLFSPAAKLFSGLLSGKGISGKLLRSYGGRMVAFDHPALSASPMENSRWLLEHLQPGRVARYDIIAHGRGGLVARTLVEELRTDRRRKLTIDRVVLVGAPNHGTPLVSPRAYSSLALWLANLPYELPGTALERAREFLAELLKLLAWGIEGTLPGLDAMNPRSGLLNRLNRPSPLGGALYHTIAGEFERPEKLLLRMVDAGIDKLFHEEANDLMVACSSALELDRKLPAARKALFSPYASDPSLKAQVHHFSYFREKKCLRRLAGFLGLPPVERSAAPATGTHRLLSPRPVPMAAEPVFLGPMPRLEISVVGNYPAERLYREWERKWRRDLKQAGIPLPPWQPFPFLFVSSGMSRVVSTFKTRGDETHWHSLIGTERSLRRYLEEEGGEPSLERLERAGKMLFRTLFPPPVKALLDRAREAAAGRSPVLVTFTSTNPWVADFPWEMIFDPGGGRFLGLGDVCFFRGVVSGRAAITPPALPMVIRMLIAIAQPKDQALLNAVAETRALREALSHLVEAKRLYIDVLAETTLSALKRKLKQTRYHILHYIGHGDYDEEDDVGKLIFLKERTGVSRSTEADELCALLSNLAPTLRLVVLNGCETAEGGRADFNRGVAPSLVAAGIPAAVGNRLIVGDKAAVAFAATFYEELSRRRSLAEAVTSARRVLASSSQFSPHEWAVPVVFALNPEERLF